MAKRASRYAGRGGLGAVMASKGLKFIVLDREGAPGVQIVDKALFDQGRKKLIDALRTHDITKPKGGLNTYGTAVLINIMNEAGGLPTRNFSSGRFEGAAKIAGEAIFEGNKERTGKETLQPCLQPRLHHPVLQHLAQARRHRAYLLPGVRVRLGAGRQLRHRQPGRDRRDDSSCATTTAWTPSRPAPPSAWPWKPG